MILLHTNAPAVVRRRVPLYDGVYSNLGWTMFPTIDRVYVNEKARLELSWSPKRNFLNLMDSLRAGENYLSPLAVAVGSKGYHAETFEDGLYPV